jgi:hypothetical protein
MAVTGATSKRVKFEKAKTAPVLGALCVAVFALSAPMVGHAQFGPPPSSLQPRIKPTGLIFQAADALGMVRGNNEDRFDFINRIQYSVEGIASPARKDGTTPTLKIKATVSISYYQHASRIEEFVTGADGVEHHRVEVVAGPYAWDETKPGIGGVANMAAAKERQREIWLTPHGFFYQVLKAGPDGVKIGKTDGATTLTVDIDGAPVTATLDKDLRPAKIETQIVDRNLGPTTETWEYSGYKDFDYYAVQFPSHMTRKLGGKTNLDLTVTNYRSGPYFLFPQPDDIAKLAAAGPAH